MNKDRTLNVDGKEYPLLSIIWDQPQPPFYRRAVLVDGELTIVQRSKEPYGVKGIEEHDGWKFSDTKDKDEKTL